MKIYFAGSGKKTYQDILYEQGARNILLSFYYDKDEDIKKLKERGFDIFVDSGGYSARKQGSYIDVQEYRKFLEQNKEYICTAANLDVMDIDESFQNQKCLEEVYPVLPVYHYQEYIEKKEQLLIDLCKNYKYIAIGGIAGMNTDKKLLMNFLNYCFRTIIKYKDVKVHGFGITNLELLTKYPFYSVDSTTWLIGGQFGMNIRYNNFKIKTTIHYSDKEEMLRNNISVKKIDDYKERLRGNVKETFKMQKDITRLWKSRGIDYEM